MKKIIKKTTKKSTVKNTPVKDSVRKLSKTAKIHLIGLVVLLVLIGGCFYKFGIVAIVNGKPIYRMAYIKELQKSDKTILEQMVQDALIKGEAENKGITIEQNEIDEAIKKIEDQVVAQGMKLEDALKSEGMTRETLIEQIRIQKIAEKLASPSADPTQEEIDSWLKTNKDYLSKTATKEELQTLAREQLKSQAQNMALNNWFTELKNSAKIIYR